MQEPIHPVDPEMLNALIPVILAWVLMWISIDFGLWEKFFTVITSWDLHGVMGLWGE
jgi:hypothetical protein